MKIDCHVHIACNSAMSGGYAKLGWPQRLGAALLSKKLGTHGASTFAEAEHGYLKRLKTHVASSELDAAVLLAFDEVYLKNGARCAAQSRFFVPNHFVADCCREEPLFLFGASVHPFREDALERLDKVAEQGAVLVKLLPNSHNFDPADRQLRPYYRKLASLGLPLLLHGGYEHTITALNQSYGNPARFRWALEEGCTVIVAHGGSAGRMHRNETMGAFLSLLKEYPHCYGDTSALTNWWRSHYLKELLSPPTLERKYGIALEQPLLRFVHGTDYPVPITPLSLGRAVAKQARREPYAGRNPLQLDISLKRAVGVPDDCLTLGAQILRLQD